MKEDRNGWICSYRAIWDHPFFKGNGMRVAIWHWLLHNAAWQQTEHRVGGAKTGAKIRIERGEVCFSQQQIQDDTGASRKQVRDVIQWLIEGGKARKIRANDRANGGANVRANAKTLLAIDKYDEYQSKKLEGANEGANSRATLGPTKEQVNNITLTSSEEEVDQSAFDEFNVIAGGIGWPKVISRSKPRLRAVSARIKEIGSLQAWVNEMKRAAASDFLSGRNTGTTPACFDWLMKPVNFTKLIEGNYDNKPNAGPSGPRGQNAASSPHGQMVAGFAAYASQNSGGSPSHFRDDPGCEPTGGERLDSGPGGDHAYPLLRVINPE